MNKKLFFSLLLLSSAGLYALENDVKNAGKKVGQITEEAAHKMEHIAAEADSRAKAIARKIAEQSDNLADNAKVESKKYI